MRKTSGKHLEHTWNPHESTQIPPWNDLENTWKTPGTYLESTQIPPWNNLENIWKTPGTHLELTWNEHGLLGFRVESNSVCGIYLDSMELPRTMWNQCGFHEERWGSVNCCSIDILLLLTYTGLTRRKLVEEKGMEIRKELKGME